MKANELMIGDWMRFADGVQKVMVVGIKMDARYREKDLIITVENNRYHWIEKSLDELRPIPLTADILEANGWERNPLLKYNDELRILDDYYELNIHEFKDGTWNVQYDCIEMGSIPMCSMNICYVHELQHFLRAVGIDEEIKIKWTRSNTED